MTKRALTLIAILSVCVFRLPPSIASPSVTQHACAGACRVVGSGGRRYLASHRSEKDFKYHTSVLAHSTLFSVTHTTQADWMAGERDHLDVRVLDALGTPYGLDHDPRGAIRLRSRPGEWRKHPQSPVIVPGERGAWDDAVISEAKVLYDGRTFHMWYAGRRRGPPGLKMPMDLGYATSPDGVHWTKYASGPVLKRGPLGTYDENMITAASVLYDGERFRMWFSAVDFRGDWSINYALSTDGIHWEKHHGNPLFTETHDERWDAVYIAEPCVIFDGHAFQMWYNGASAHTETLIGHATSSDGVHWVRSDRPVLTVGPDRAWDDFAVARAHVIYDGEQYKMWYEGHDGKTWRIGYATSADGTRWTRFPGNPIVDLGTEGAWDGQVVSEPFVLFDGRTYRLWHSGYDGERYRVGLVTAPAIYDRRGVFVSPPITSERAIEWGTLTCDLVLPSQTDVRVEVSAGQDGQAWTPWSVAARSCVSGVNRLDLTSLGLPASRYLRYRLTLTTADPAFSPLVRQVTVAEAAPDFSLTLTRREASLRPGELTTVPVVLDSLRGFDKPVCIRTDGLPDKVSVTWRPLIFHPPQEFAITLGAADDGPVGTYSFTLTAQSGDLIHSSPLTVTILSPLPTPTPHPTATPYPTPVPLPTPTSLPPPAPRRLELWLKGTVVGVFLPLIWFLLGLLAQLRRRRKGESLPWWQHWAWAALWCLLPLWGINKIGEYIEQRKQVWEAYCRTIPPGVRVAGVDAGGLTAGQLAQALREREVYPYRRDIVVHYLNRTAVFDTAQLDMHTNLEQVVGQAVRVGQEAAPDLAEFVWRNPAPLDVHLTFTRTFDFTPLRPWVQRLAAEVDRTTIEHAVDPDTLIFERGQPGIHLEVDEGVRRLQAAITTLNTNLVTVSVSCTSPHVWDEREIELQIARLNDRWQLPPAPATAVQVAIPFDRDRWIVPGVKAADWQPTRPMTGYAFLPGRMGWTLYTPSVRAVLSDSLASGVPQALLRVFTDVLPAPVTLSEVKPLLLEIAGHFDGLTGFYVQDLTTGREIRHNTYITTSGMSMLKVAIMVTAYRCLPRPFPPELQEAIEQMIVHSINERSNQVIASIGEGDFGKGLQRVNETLRALGMYQTYITSGYHTPEGPAYASIPVPERPAVDIPPDERLDLSPDPSMQTSLSDQAIIFEALYRGAQGQGRLLAAFPTLTPADCCEMLELLKRNPTRTLLGPGFGDDVPLAHKNGFGGGAHTDERMDVGIVWPPGGRPYLVGIYQWDDVPWIHWLRVWPQQIEFSATLYSYFTMPPPLPARSPPPCTDAPRLWGR